MSDHSNLHSALLTPSAMLASQPGLLPAAEVYPATQIFSSTSPFLPVYVQQPAILPCDRPEPIPIDQYRFDTLSLYNPNDRRSPAEQWRMLPRPIDIKRGMTYELTFGNAIMLYSWIKGVSKPASRTNMYHDARRKEEELKNGSITSLIASKFNKSLEKETARLRPMVLAEMQMKNCCFSCLVHNRGKPCHHPYPQRPTEAVNWQGGVQNEHGERLNHVQRGQSSTARSGAQQPTPQATPAIRTVGSMNAVKDRLITNWNRTEGDLLARISSVAFHGIIASGGQETRDLEQVLSWIDGFVMRAKHRFDGIRSLSSAFCTAVLTSSGNTRTPAPSPCLNSLGNIKNFTWALIERLMIGLLRILVPLFTIHPDMGTTEALLMLRIEGCKRGWIPFLTEVFRVAFGGKDGAECRYLCTRAQNRGLWEFWRMVLTGNRWAIDAIADPRTISNGLSTSSLKVYLMPMGWDGKGWEGLVSSRISGRRAWFQMDGVCRMIREMHMQIQTLTLESRRRESQRSQQSGGSSSNHRNSNSNSRPPPPWPNSSQMGPMTIAVNYGQQPQQNGIVYGGMYPSPPGPLPNGYNSHLTPANGYGRASGSGSQKRRREEAEEIVASASAAKWVKIFHNPATSHNSVTLHTPATSHNSATLHTPATSHNSATLHIPATLHTPAILHTPTTFHDPAHGYVHASGSGSQKRRREEGGQEACASAPAAKRMKPFPNRG
ncbi:hypothetical protein NEUTE1DRAFT_141217 [Neurospora tetrasperma FGSC 2508]|uniref:Uncharacterized protein n=1 Tax=Neurospora tetrasperma (strain FGSC 2508 / ATCC MYA-4615 / P0657) TaxID=510951 RepID=F8MXT6_NEUT8|nr:uncharacterized protein NEUTE1DRAFT_141217 [Neurospora tetrasperma FGSC 2508]EGO53887.1 hypothetical protein NEUTE1DRAFT_141217 [Neurospora tetrasperma FGSC 2508]EGZ75694.1 hypothetical protein NEUTE2DRAFT_57146 [Neurospora tetrasperma FGSC 2509]